MDNEAIEKEIEALLRPVIGAMGFELVELRVLNEQGWYREDSKKVSAVLEERGVNIQDFSLFNPGA